MISDPAFQVFRLLSVIQNRFHASENKAQVCKMYNADRYHKTTSDFQCLFLSTSLCTSIDHFYQFSNNLIGSSIGKTLLRSKLIASSQCPVHFVLFMKL